MTLWCCSVFWLASAVGAAPPLARAESPKACTRGSLYIAAHADDPLLFMLPDLDRDITAGRCVEVVILTAGDAGHGRAYWQRREAGLANALAVLAGMSDRWRARNAGIPRHRAPLYTLPGDARLRLVFLRLPDGRSDGAGFDGRGSMRQLWENVIPKLTSLPVGRSGPSYRPSTYTRTGLIDALHWLMVQARPSKIGVQDYAGSIDGTGDHADHRAGAHFALAAARSYRGPGTLVGYLDYQILGYPPDVEAKDAKRKRAAWYAYLPYDTLLAGTCADDAACLSPGNYGNYWSRQYTITPPIPLPASP